jgi:uncharacterized membrane protein HdeD (DUF308 family)
MTDKKAPAWLRALDIVFGLAAIGLSIFVLLYPELAVATLIFVLSITLLIIGVGRLIIGIFARYLPDRLRTLISGAGILSIILATMTLLYPEIATQMLIYLLSFALMFIGVTRVLVGGFGKFFPAWLRGFLVVVGLLTIVMSVAAVVLPALGFLTLVFMLAMTFLLNGIARTVSGIIGLPSETELDGNA